MDGIRHQPLAPNKELPFLVFNLLHFPNDAAAEEYEREIGKWWPELLLFIGRITGGGPDIPIPGNSVSEKFTHILVWRYQNFDQYRRQREGYAADLEHASKPEGDWPGYLQDAGWGFYAVDQRDPVLGEHGLDEWNNRLVSEVFQSTVDRDPEKAAAAREIVYRTFRESAE
jgi:hypothetical protein